MTTSHGRAADADFGGVPAEDDSDDEAPRLNAYEIHSDRTVLTEPGNTDGWIASDVTVELRA
ncbi:MAG: hypothetical protein ABEH78_07155 [Haloferacaceae archaeon]